MPAADAISRIFAAGPTRIGTINPFAPASIAPASAVASQGYATAVGTGVETCARASSRSYFPVPVVLMSYCLAFCSRDRVATADPVSFNRRVSTMASATPYSSGTNAVW